ECPFARSHGRSGELRLPDMPEPPCDDAVKHSRAAGAELGHTHRRHLDARAAQSPTPRSVLVKQGRNGAGGIDYDRPDRRISGDDRIEVRYAPLAPAAARVLILVKLDMPVTIRPLPGERHRRPRQIRPNLDAKRKSIDSDAGSVGLLLPVWPRDNARQ